MGKPSGRRPHYTREGGLTKTSYICNCHGRPFDTRVMLGLHVNQFKKRVRTDFAALVREGGLGQQPWDRLPGESALQYSRFKVYLGTMDKTSQRRSMERTAKMMGDVRYRNLLKVAADWHWQTRAALLDQYIEHQELQKFIEGKAKSARNQARLGQKLQALAMAGASAMLSDPDRVAEMTGHEISKLAREGVTIERLANSDPTQISEDRSVRIVWEGPRPDWAPADEAPQLPATTPTTIEGE